MIATLLLDREFFAGGAIAAANHVAGFCKEVRLITALGDGEEDANIVTNSLKPNIILSEIKLSDRPTTRKSRFVDPSYLRKLFEVYDMNDSPIDSTQEDELNALINEHIDNYDLVLVTDFGHGLLGSSTVKLIVDRARFLAVNAQTNSANQGFNLITKYPRADYICIDAPEARLATGDKFGDIANIASQTLPNLFDCDRIVITHGKYGCISYAADQGVVHIPAFTKTAVDTVGAGDAFLSVTAPIAAIGGSMEHIGFIGNAAGAMKVGIVGHRQSIEMAALVKFITALLK